MEESTGLSRNILGKMETGVFCVLLARQKWHTKKPNLKEGVLLKDKQGRRNEWSIGRVVKTFPSDDGLVRKVDIKVVSHHPPKTYLGPVSELVLFLEAETV